MNGPKKFMISVLALTTACLAQGLTVHFKGKQKWPAAEAERIYFSACSVIQREFGNHQGVKPRVTLVLGADRDVVSLDEREIRITKWDRHAFAQGVVVFAFEDLISVEQRLMLAKRAVTWADSTIDVERPAK